MRILFLKRIVVSVTLGAFLSTGVMPSYAQEVALLPSPGQMVGLSEAFVPALLKGMTIHPEDPLLFDFIVDNGQSALEGQALTDETTRLVKYFLAGLTVPAEALWVNLSPVESGRIMADGLSRTDVGRDMLAQDYILKQITATLMYPEKDPGREFWAEVYKRSFAEFGTTDVPVDTFNKVWITPDAATVYQNGNNAFVAQAHLKVMLESDYLAGTSQQSILPAQESAKEVVRAVILPVLEKEVNEGRHFAALRQIFYSMILAGWYKNALRQSLLNQVYSDMNKVQGIDIADKDVREKIYARYMEAYRKGVYNYIREEAGADAGQTVERRYFSGGLNFDAAMKPGIEPDKGRAGLVRRFIGKAVKIMYALHAQVQKVDIFGVNQKELTIGDIQGEYRYRQRILIISLIDPVSHQGSGSRYVLVGPNFRYDVTDDIDRANDAQGKVYQFEVAAMPGWELEDARSIKLEIHDASQSQETDEEWGWAQNGVGPHQHKKARNFRNISVAGFKNKGSGGKIIGIYNEYGEYISAGHIGMIGFAKNFDFRKRKRPKEELYRGEGLAGGSPVDNAERQESISVVQTSVITAGGVRDLKEGYVLKTLDSFLGSLRKMGEGRGAHKAFARGSTLGDVLLRRASEERPEIVGLDGETWFIYDVLALEGWFKTVKDSFLQAMLHGSKADDVFQVKSEWTAVVGGGNYNVAVSLALGQLEKFKEEILNGAAILQAHAKLPTVMMYLARKENPDLLEKVASGWKVKNSRGFMDWLEGKISVIEAGLTDKAQADHSEVVALGENGEAFIVGQRFKVQDVLNELLAFKIAAQKKINNDAQDIVFSRLSDEGHALLLWADKHNPGVLRYIEEWHKPGKWRLYDGPRFDAWLDRQIKVFKDGIAAKKETNRLAMVFATGNPVSTADALAGYRLLKAKVRAAGTTLQFAPVEDAIMYAIEKEYGPGGDTEKRIFEKSGPDVWTILDKTSLLELLDKKIRELGNSQNNGRNVVQGGIDLGQGNYLKVIATDAAGMPAFDPAELIRLQHDLRGVTPVPVGGPQPVDPQSLI